jgi:hypothetical protein
MRASGTILPGRLTLKSRHLLQATSSFAIFALIVFLAVELWRPVPEPKPRRPLSVPDSTSTAPGLKPAAADTRSKLQIIADLNANWPDVRTFKTPMFKTNQLLSASCKMLLAYDGEGTVLPVQPTQLKPEAGLGSYFEIFPHHDGEQTVSLVKPDNPMTAQPGWALAVEHNALKMELVSDEQRPNLPVKYRFRLRKVKNPLAEPDYADGCKPVALANNMATYLLEPLSSPGCVLRWHDSSFELTPAPPPRIDTPQPFETEAVFLFGFPNR